MKKYIKKTSHNNAADKVKNKRKWQRVNKKFK